jgi:hypothetical protein
MKHDPASAPPAPPEDESVDGVAKRVREAGERTRRLLERVRSWHVPQHDDQPGESGGSAPK